MNTMRVMIMAAVTAAIAGGPLLAQTSEKDTLLKLGDKQGTNHTNTVVAQKKAENTRDAIVAAVDIRRAADHMSDAAAALNAIKQQQAVKPATEAIAAIEEAIKKLEEQKKKVDDQLRDKDLAQFQKQYEEIRDRQVAVKAASDGVEQRRLSASDKQVDRPGLLELSKQSKEQNDLIDVMAGLNKDEKLKEYEVIIWMNNDIQANMDASRERMNRAQTGRELARVQQTAIDRLNDIIEALKQEQQKKDEFEKPGGGGGGGGGGGKPPLIPPVAQLKLLKAMQTVVNNDTVGRYKDMQGAQDAEKSAIKQDVAKLGKKQGEIETMAGKVMEKLQR